MWEQSRRLYVAEFRNGVIKIGVTRRPGTRRSDTLKRHGVITRIHYGQHHACGFWGENELIRRMRRIGSTFKGREWFTGVHFAAARQLVDQVTRMAHATAAKAA